MRKAQPGQHIADRIKAGELDAAGALVAVQDELSAGMDSMDDMEMDDEQRSEMERERKREEEQRHTRVRALGFRLSQLARDQVNLRQATEERWYQDVRQFNGQYDPGTFDVDESGEMPFGSRVFVPLTRRLVNLCEARLFDMLFQAGERNFVLKPTPVPDIDQAGELAEQLPGDQPLNTPEGPIQAGSIQQAIKALVEEAQRRSDAMQREIDDQLAECKYSIHARNAIHDAVLLGTGVLKGPFALYKTAKRWEQGAQGYALKMERRPVPVTVRVDPWNFFPDMSATTVDECEFAFERHFLTKKQVAELKNMEDVDLDALREILGAEPAIQANNHRERLRAINGANGAPDKRYEVWEYHGPLTADDLRDCGCEVGEEDPLEQYTGIVWFCEGVVLKAALNPLDTGSLPFRVFTWQKDETNIFGYGLPYEVRDQQVSANSSFRAMLDNMGLCVKPQVAIDDTKAEPVNGRYDLEPGKFWRIKSGRLDDALQFKEIESRMEELQNIFVASKQLIEEVGTLPAFMAGQDAPAPMQSATQASISWTAANLWVRRCVRNWDDDVVTPLIGDYYDWNMQHSPKEEIKGDSQIQALGIAALVELEGQAQKMQQFIEASKALGVPPSSQLMLLRQFARSYKLDPDLMLPTEADIAKMKAAEEKNPPIDIDRKKLEVAQENNQLDAKASADLIAFRMQELADRQQDREARLQMTLATIASNERISMEEARQKYGFEAEKTVAQLQDKQQERAHKAQMFNAESQLRVQTGAGI